MMKTNIIILQGATSSGKTMIASLLLEYYQSSDLKALLFDDFEDNGDQIQKLFDSNYYDYILIALLPGEDHNVPCLKTPWKTITIT